AKFILEADPKIVPGAKQESGRPAPRKLNTILPGHRLGKPLVLAAVHGRRRLAVQSEVKGPCDARGWPRDESEGDPLAADPAADGELRAAVAGGPGARDVAHARIGPKF